MKTWMPLILYLIIQSITPGPNNLTCLFLGGKYGLKGTKKFLIASMTGLFIKALLCGGLNLALAEIMPPVVNVLKWIGAAYLLYLAYKMIRSGWEDDISVTGQQTESTYRSGFILQLLNAKSWIVSISTFAVYVIPVSQKFSTILWVAFAFVIIAGAASLLWALCGTALKNFITRYKKPFGIIMGLSLIYCAVTAVL